MWNLNGSADLRYNGDYVAGSYSDGDIVVYQGVAYLCVRPTSSPPAVWPGIGIQSGPSARVWNNAATAVNMAATVTIPFTTLRWDTDSMWSSGSPTRLTVRTPGKYRIGACVHMTGWAGQTGFFDLGIKVNGTPIGTQSRVPVPSGTNGTSLWADQDWDLQVGDYVEVQVTNNANANTTTYQAPNTWACEFWMTMEGGPQGPQGPAGAGTPGYGTALPGSPVDGQEYILVDSLTNPSYQWRFRYNAGNTTAYKWEFVGGPPVVGRLNNQETCPTGAGLKDIATVGPSVVLPRDGVYLCEWGVLMNPQNTALSGYGGSLVCKADNTQVTSTEADGISTGGGGWQSGAASEVVTTTATTHKLRYHNQSNGSITFGNRWLQMTPVRVS